MKQLLISTTNPGKLAEIKNALGNLPVKLITPNDLGIKEKPKETGKTFAENAMLKAKFYFDKTGIPTIADDGGLEIDALGGEPGVNSHRWISSDKESTDEELINYTIEKLNGVPLNKRGAQLRLIMVYIDSQGKIHQMEEKVRGVIPLIASNNRTSGYPYRSLLFLPEINKYYNEVEMTAVETEKYGHRIRAVGKLMTYIRQIE